MQNISTKKNNEEVLKQQREIGEANIKADVVSKSRIEWIQKVREESANRIHRRRISG